MTEEVVVLEPGDERAKKIGKAMASPVANGILQNLSDGPKTASDLTGILDVPMGTLKYHIENLLDAGLIEIRETRYSVKGREVKVYALRDQLLIVAPKVTSIRSILVRYTSLFAIVAIASMAMFAILPLFLQGTPGAETGSAPATLQVDDRGGGGGILTEKASAGPAPSLPWYASPVLAFFLGGSLVLLVLFLYEAYLWQKDSPR